MVIFLIQTVFQKQKKPVKIPILFTCFNLNTPSPYFIKFGRVGIVEAMG